MIHKIWGAIALFFLFNVCCKANIANLTKIEPLEIIENKLITSDEVNKDIFHQLDSLLRAYSDNPAVMGYLNRYDTFLSDHPAYKQYRAGFFYSKAFIEYANFNLGSAYYYGKLAYKTAIDHGKIRILISAAYMLMCIEYQNNNYKACIHSYKQVAPLLYFFSRKIKKCPPEYTILITRMCGIATNVAITYIAQNDLVKAGKVLLLNDAFLQIAENSMRHDDPHYLSAKYQVLSGKYNYLRKQGQNVTAYLDTMYDLVLQPHYPQTERNNNLVSIYRYYITHAFLANDFDKMTDYLYRMKEVKLTQFIAFRLQRDAIFYEGMSFVYKHNKNYLLSTEAKEKVMLVEDSLNNLLLAAQFKNLYAKADAEFHKNELVLETNRKNTYRRYLNLAVYLGSLLIAGGILAIFYIRYKQRTNLIISRLAIARDIHDEIGPMLLYAKIMTGIAKTDGSKHQIDMANLDEQLGATLEKVRTLAKRIKSGIDEPVSFPVFSEQLVAILEKNKKISGIEYKIDIEDGHAQTIPLETSAQMKIVLGELVCNSLKHGMCDLIRIKISFLKHQMILHYSDDGRGFNSDALYNTDGQGLANIKERVKNLNGTTIFKNHFPSGYAIEIIVPI